MIQTILLNSTSILFAALMLALGARWFIAPSERGRIEKLFVVCCPIVPLSLWIVGHVLAALTSLSMPVMDLYAYHVGGWIGYPSFRIAGLVQAHLWSRLLFEFVYDTFTLIAVLVIGVYLWHRPKETGRVALAFFLNLTLAVGFYLIFPICGPKYAFPTFPHLPGVVPIRTLILKAPPNGMPSAHVSNALLVLWFLRRWRSGRIAGTVFAILTAVAVMSTGEHYFVDVLAAVPYAGLVLYLSGGETCALIQFKVVRTGTRKPARMAPNVTFVSRILFIINRYLPDEQ